MCSRVPGGAGLGCGCHSDFRQAWGSVSFLHNEDNGFLAGVVKQLRERAVWAERVSGLN